MWLEIHIGLEGSTFAAIPLIHSGLRAPMTNIPGLECALYNTGSCKVAPYVTARGILLLFFGFVFGSLAEEKSMLWWPAKTLSHEALVL